MKEKLKTETEMYNQEKVTYEDKVTQLEAELSHYKHKEDEMRSELSEISALLKEIANLKE